MNSAALVKVTNDDREVSITLWVYDERGKFVTNAVTWIPRETLIAWADAIALQHQATQQEQLPF